MPSGSAPGIAPALVVMTLSLLAPGTLAALDCVVYQPITCLFGPAAEAAGNAAKCGQSTAPCAFSVRKDVGCLFPETGRFMTKPAKRFNCQNSFMTTTSSPPRKCGARCCAADYPTGRFEVSGAWSTGAKKYSYIPNSPDGCKYAEMTRGQVMFHLRKLKSPIVIFGDSLMRQLFLRLVGMLRGQERLFDYKIFTHAQYLACEQADALRISRNSPVAPFSKRNDTYLEQIMPSFFSMKEGPGIAATKAVLAACKRPPVQAHYVSGPTFVNQTSAIKSYMAALPALGFPEGARPVYIVGVDFWDKGGVVDPLYLNAVYALKYTGGASKVFLVGVPSFHERNATVRLNYQRRNQQMRAWVEGQGEPFHYVDFDAISSAAARPPGPSGGDKHFGCLVWWNKKVPIAVDGSADGMGANGRPEPQIQSGGVQRIHVNGDGRCADEYNRALWTAILNVMIPPAGVQIAQPPASASGTAPAAPPLSSPPSPVPSPLAPPPPRKTKRSPALLPSPPPPLSSPPPPEKPPATVVWAPPPPPEA